VLDFSIVGLHEQISIIRSFAMHTSRAKAASDLWFEPLRGNPGQLTQRKLYL
jgi:hypothetical protein